MEKVLRLVRYVTETGVVELGLVEDTEGDVADVRVVIPGMSTQKVVKGVRRSSSGEKNTWEMAFKKKSRDELKEREKDEKEATPAGRYGCRNM